MSILSTPYYRVITDVKPVGCSEEGPFTYDSYDIFCIETQLYPALYRLVDRDVILVFKGIPDGTKINLGIELTRVVDTDDPSILDEQVFIEPSIQRALQKVVDTAISDNLNYCLIDREELYRSRRMVYPRSWFNSVLPFVDLSTSYNPYIQPQGIYLSFNRKADFTEAYNQVVKEILDKIDGFYQNGAIVGASSIASSWNLERLDIDDPLGLYAPVWTDNRFASNMVDFLLERLTGDEYIKIAISKNLVRRHYIADMLTKQGIVVLFEGDHVKIQVNDLDSAQKAASIVEAAEGLADGKVVVQAVSRPSWIQLYTKAAALLGNASGPVAYRVDSIDTPYMFSLQIDAETDADLFLDNLQHAVYKTLIQDQEDIMNRPSIQSPHDIIEA